MMQTTRHHRSNLTRLFWGATFAGCVLAIAGCSSNDLHGEDFADPASPRATGTLLQNQAAASAATQGQLQEQDFQNNTLNSLGEVELDLIVKGTPPTQPVVVPLDFVHPVSGDALAARESSATEYLEDRGVPKAEIQFVEGPNTATSTPTAAVLPFAYRSDGGSFTGASPDQAGSGTGGGTGH